MHDNPIDRSKRMGSYHSGETAQQFGDREPEDQPVKGKEEAESVHGRPPASLAEGVRGKGRR